MRRPKPRWAALCAIACTLAVVHAPVAEAQQNGGPARSGTTVISKAAHAPLTPAENSTIPHTAPGPRVADAAAGSPPEATAASLYSDANTTTFRLDLSRGITAEIFTLGNPYRVIVDLPNVSFRLPAGAGKQGRGLVKAFRYGLFAEGKARIVLDTTGPVRIERAEMTGAPDGRSIVFTFDLVEIPAASFGKGTGAKRPQKTRSPSSESKRIDRSRPSKRGKPVIMIDPGHGGIDGGATAGRDLLEKDVVLAVAKQLRRALKSKGGFDVRMTRKSDVFVSLNGRLKASRESGADLFISLHADSLGNEAFVTTTRGATVYTLSERASDEQARLMAEKENASDLIAGLEVAEGTDYDQVNSILIDLMRRETANFSADFSKLLTKKLRRQITLSRRPMRSAAFKVLKQTNSPSVLVELGYLSNPEDQKLLGSRRWQQKAAAAIASAVETYFSRRAASAP
jgi:N-acetylmuramoyl-L-alanine amidase